MECYKAIQERDIVEDDEGSDETAVCLISFFLAVKKAQSQLLHLCGAKLILLVHAKLKR